MSEPVVRARSLSKVFETRVALQNVDLELHAGEVVALLGPNGAGKSTLLNIFAALGRPSRGEVALFGLPLARAASESRHRIGVCAHVTFLYDDLTAEENLRFYAKLYGVAASAVLPMLERFGVATRRADRVRTLSRGLQQRVALARALLHSPELILFDEPTTGLDLAATTLLVSVVKAERARGACIVVATHDLHAAAALADRALVLSRGRLVHDAPCDPDPARLAARYAEVTALAAPSVRAPAPSAAA